MTCRSAGRVGFSPRGQDLLLAPRLLSSTRPGALSVGAQFIAPAMTPRLAAPLRHLAAPFAAQRDRTPSLFRTHSPPIYLPIHRPGPPQAHRHRTNALLFSTPQFFSNLSASIEACCARAPDICLHPSSFRLHPSSFFLHPSSFRLHPSSFFLLCVSAPSRLCVPSYQPPAGRSTPPMLATSALVGVHLRLCLSCRHRPCARRLHSDPLRLPQFSVLPHMNSCRIPARTPRMTLTP